MPPRLFRLRTTIASTDAWVRTERRVVGHLRARPDKA